MDQRLIKRNLKAVSDRVYWLATLLALAVSVVVGALFWPLVAATVGQKILSSPEREEGPRSGDHTTLQ